MLPHTTVLRENTDPASVDICTIFQAGFLLCFFPMQGRMVVGGAHLSCQPLGLPLHFELQRPSFLLFALLLLSHFSEMRVCLWFYKDEGCLVPKPGGSELWFHPVFALKSPKQQIPNYHNVHLQLTTGYGKMGISVRIHELSLWTQGSHGPLPKISQDITRTIHYFPQTDDKAMLLKKTLQISVNTEEQNWCLTISFLLLTNSQNTGRYFACCWRRTVQLQTLRFTVVTCL